MKTGRRAAEMGPFLLLEEGGPPPPPAVLVRVVDVDHLPPGRGGGKETAIGAT